VHDLDDTLPRLVGDPLMLQQAFLSIMAMTVANGASRGAVFTVNVPVDSPLSAGASA
jgi:DNA gyrase inhibitor GyrI